MSAMASLLMNAIAGCACDDSRLKWIKAMPTHFSIGATSAKNVTAIAKKTSVSQSFWRPDITEIVSGAKSVLPPSQEGISHFGSNRVRINGANHAIGKATTRARFKTLATECVLITVFPERQLNCPMDVLDVKSCATLTHCGAGGPLA